MLEVLQRLTPRPAGVSVQLSVEVRDMDRAPRQGRASILSDDVGLAREGFRASVPCSQPVAARVAGGHILPRPGCLRAR